MVIKSNKIKVLGGKTGWNYTSQSKPASVSQQKGSFQIFGGATAESEGAAVAKRESQGGGCSKGIEGMGGLVLVTGCGVLLRSGKGV